MRSFGPPTYCDKKIKEKPIPFCNLDDTPIVKNRAPKSKPTDMVIRLKGNVGLASQSIRRSAIDSKYKATHSNRQNHYMKTEQSKMVVAGSNQSNNQWKKSLMGTSRSVVSPCGVHKRNIVQHVQNKENIGGTTSMGTNRYVINN